MAEHAMHHTWYQNISNSTVISIGFIFQVRCECAVLTVVAGKDWCSTWDGNKYDLVFYGVSGYTGYLMMERSWFGSFLHVTALFRSLTRQSSTIHLSSFVVFCRFTNPCSFLHVVTACDCMWSRGMWRSTWSACPSSETLSPSLLPSLVEHLRE